MDKLNNIRILIRQILDDSPELFYFNLKASEQRGLFFDELNMTNGFIDTETILSPFIPNLENLEKLKIELESHKLDLSLIRRISKMPHIYMNPDLILSEDFFKTEVAKYLDTLDDIDFCTFKMVGFSVHISDVNNTNFKIYPNNYRQTTSENQAISESQATDLIERNLKQECINKIANYLKMIETFIEVYQNTNKRKGFSFKFDYKK